jgi:hypothetical protein
LSIVQDVLQRICRAQQQKYSGIILQLQHELRC